MTACVGNCGVTVCVLRVRVYVSVCVSAYVCVCVSVYVCVSLCVYVCVYKHVLAYREKTQRVSCNRQNANK